MSTALSDAFASNSARNRRLDDLMDMCRHLHRIVSVMVIGCGDAFINRYWPKLHLLVNQGCITLTIVDLEPLDSLIEKKIELAKSSGETKNAAQLQASYGNLQQMLINCPDKIKYLNRNDSADYSWYQHLTQDIVFLLVPDDIHIKYALEWLKRATLVLIEKPYNRDLVEAQYFEGTLNQIICTDGADLPHTYVVCIDHYLAKIFRFVMRRNESALQKQLGVIKGIEFALCEAGGVESWRAASLAAGMVYDLFCHILAQISPFVNLGTYLSSSEPSTLLVAQHTNCPPPFRTESYAHITNNCLQDYQGRRVSLAGYLGKGVGQRDEKFLRIIGEQATLVADFGPTSSGQLFLESQAGVRSPVFEIGKGHPEIIDAIFEGRFIPEPVGGLAGKTAIQILEILTSIRTKIDRSRELLGQQTYAIGTTPQEIDKLAIRLS